MTGFKNYLIESATDYNWDALKGVTKYMKGETDARKDRFVAALDRFKAAIDGTQDLFNADYKEMYTYHIGRLLEAAYEKTRGYGGPKWDDWTLFSVASIPKLIRLAKAAPKGDVPADCMAFLLAIEKYPDLIKALKPLIKSGRKPTEASMAKDAAKAKFTVAVKHDNAQKVIDALHKSAEDIRKKYEVATTEAFESMVEKAISRKGEALAAIDKKFKSKWQIDAAKQTWYKHVPDITTGTEMLMQNCVIDMKTGEVKSDWKANVAKKAVESVNAILQEFIAKNTKKLAEIVAKRDLKTIKIVENALISGTFMNNKLALDFNDGASFTIYTQVIWKWSNRGTMFNQFPTRFQNVKNSDGTMMKNPTEERMHTDWK